MLLLDLDDDCLRRISDAIPKVLVTCEDAGQPPPALAVACRRLWHLLGGRHVRRYRPLEHDPTVWVRLHRLEQTARVHSLSVNTRCPNIVHFVMTRLAPVSLRLVVPTGDHYVQRTLVAAFSGPPTSVRHLHVTAGQIVNEHMLQGVLDPDALAPVPGGPPRWWMNLRSLTIDGVVRLVPPMAIDRLRGLTRLVLRGVVSPLPRTLRLPPGLRLLHLGLQCSTWSVAERQVDTLVDSLGGLSTLRRLLLDLHWNWMLPPAPAIGAEMTATGAMHPGWRRLGATIGGLPELHHLELALPLAAAPEAEALGDTLLCTLREPRQLRTLRLCGGDPYVQGMLEPLWGSSCWTGPFPAPIPPNMSSAYGSVFSLPHHAGMSTVATTALPPVGLLRVTTRSVAPVPWQRPRIPRVEAPPPDLISSWVRCAMTSLELVSRVHAVSVGIWDGLRRLPGDALAHLRHLSLDLDVSQPPGLPIIRPVTGQELPPAFAGAHRLEGLRLSVDQPLAQAWGVLARLPRLECLWVHQRARMVDAHDAAAKVGAEDLWVALRVLSVSSTPDVDLVVMDGGRAPHRLSSLFVSDVPRRPQCSHPAPMYLRGLAPVLAASAASLRDVHITCTNELTRRGGYDPLCAALRQLRAVETLRLDLRGRSWRWSPLCEALAFGPLRAPIVETVDIGPMGGRNDVLSPAWHLLSNRACSWRLARLSITLGQPLGNLEAAVKAVVRFVSAARTRLVDDLHLFLAAESGWDSKAFDALSAALAGRSGVQVVHVI